MTSWAEQLAGRFVVFDGPDGSGKTSQLRRFSGWCAEAGLEVRVVREPGGTEIGEQIRGVLLDPANQEMTLLCEMLLYMASRAQLVEEMVGPALARGELVIADRFISSTLAYQGAGGGLDADAILAVGRIALGACWPDLVVVFDVDEKTAARRMGLAADAAGTLFADRMERKTLEYRQRVREDYRRQAKDEPGRYLLIDAKPDEETVFARLLDAMEKRLG
jgi:dTMP kinase